MNPPIFEGAAGMGGLGLALSSYEAVNGLGDYFTTSSQLRGMGGLGDYIPMSGLGGTSQPRGKGHLRGFGYPGDACPPITSTFLPPGIVNHDSNGKQICDKIDANAALCNTTADPFSCYFSREYKTNYKNRQLKGEEAIWRAWQPAGSGPPILGVYKYNPVAPGTSQQGGAQAAAAAGGSAGPSAAPDPAASDDTMLYIGLGVGAVAIIGLAVWWKKRRAKAA